MPKPVKPSKPHTLHDETTAETREMQARQILLGKALGTMSRQVEAYRRDIARQSKRARKSA